MQNVEIMDMTLRASGQLSASGLSFKEKLEIAKLLEKLRVDVVETGYIGDAPADLAAVRAIADTLVTSVVCVPVGLGEEEIRRAVQALERAKKPRLNLVVPTSAVQMEYTYHRKPDSMRKALSQSAALCVSLCPDVEFTAEDATRSEPAFLAEMVQTAIDAAQGGRGPIPPRLLSIFEDMSYLMAKHARPDQVTAASSEEWLDGFDTFSVYQVFPAIAQLWQANLKTTSTPKKKRGRRKGR